MPRFLTNTGTQNLPSLDSATNLEIILVNSGYTPDLENHDFYDDVPGANRVGTAGVLQNVSVTKSAAGWTMTADSINLTVPASTAYARALVYRNVGGAESTWPLIGYDDDTGTTTGTTHTINFPSGLFRDANA